MAVRNLDEKFDGIDRKVDRLLEILPQHELRLQRLEDSRKRWAQAGKILLGVLISLATTALGVWFGISG